MAVSYPRLAARTLRFTLGIPRNIRVARDGSRVWFIRTPDGTTRTGALWVHDARSGAEECLVDPVTLLGSAGEQLSDAERSRRERSRESAAGLVGFDVDEAGRWATFALSGAVWSARLADGPGNRADRLTGTSGAIDPRIDPTGRAIAYACDGALRLVAVGGGDRVLAEPESTTQVWGQADFIAAEELDRQRGHWWAPDGRSLLVERYDTAAVPAWYIADPAHPDRAATVQRYPAAGGPNAEVTLWLVGLDGNRTQVEWDRRTYEYLHQVSWTRHGDPVIQVLSRDQRSSLVLGVDPATGATRVLRRLSSPAWVEVLPTGPRFGPGGRLVGIEDVGARRRVVVDGTPVGDDRWQVRALVEVLDDAVLATASADPTEIQVVAFGLDGSVEPLTSGAAVHAAAVGGDTTVITRAGLDAVAATVTVRRAGAVPTQIPVVTEPALFTPSVNMLIAGDRQLRTAVLFPRDHVRRSRRLPVLMNPYGGPHAQRVLACARMFLEPQWFADQGFCVIVTDGRGTPGRDIAWEHAVAGELASVTLTDQVEALAAVAAAYPGDVDTTRVGITGWSYGGYLAALAVLERPDVFHAAVAGAPVTDWRLYDTAYSERYLGDPNTAPEVYQRNSLLRRAARLRRPLLLIHGLADDNVVAAHTLRLSSALLAAGKPHTVLPLSGVTHLTPQEVVAENLMLLQLDFLAGALGLQPGYSPEPEG